MNVCVASAFRNAPERQIVNWCRQVRRLSERMSEHFVRAVAMEGDSTNNTREMLRAGAHLHGVVLDVATCNHGGPVFGSTESPERMRCLSLVANAIFDQVRDTDDVLVYVESDLIWTPETIVALIDHLDETDVVAPLVFAGDNFYDVYAYRGLDGERFAPFAPYHSHLRDASNGPHDWQNGLFAVGSVGSCLVMSERVARQVRIRNDQALVGWCAEARRLGYRISVAPGLRVEHPV